jgi:hypothetical protein
MNNSEITHDRSVLAVNCSVTGLLVADQESTGQLRRRKRCHDKRERGAPHKAKERLPRISRGRGRHRQ